MCNSENTFKAIAEELMSKIYDKMKLCNEHKVYLNFIEIQKKPFRYDHLICHLIGGELTPLYIFMVPINGVEHTVVLDSLKDYIDKEYNGLFKCTLYPRTIMDKEKLIITMLP